MVTIRGNLYRMTVDEYERLAEAAILDDPRVELIDGYLVRKTTKKPPHVVAVEGMRDALSALALPGWRVMIQDPVRIPDFDEPEPDIALARCIAQASCISGTDSGTRSLAPVAARISATETSGARSLGTSPSGVGSITARSVTTRFTGRIEVSGYVHSSTIFGRPLALWIMATMTRLAPVTRSMAPPMPGTSVPGIIQLAKRP